MLKYFLCCAFVLLSLTSKAQAWPQAFYWDLTPRIGLFLPTTESARKVFPVAEPVYQLEMSFNFDYPWMRQPWKVWANVGYLAPKGRTLFCHHDSTTWVVPLSIGMKYSWFCNKIPLELYLGAGFAGSYMGIKDDSPNLNKLNVLQQLANGNLVPDADGDFDCLPSFDSESWCVNKRHKDSRKRLKKAAGVMLKSGFRYNFCDWIYLDFFADYYHSYFGVKSKRCPRNNNSTEQMSVTDLVNHINTGNQNVVTFQGDGCPKRRKHHRRRESVNMAGFILGGGLGMAF